MIAKGKVVKTKDSGGKVWIEPTGSKGRITGDVVVPERLKGVQTGTEVVYAYFDDYTGVVLERLDGK